MATKHLMILLIVPLIGQITFAQKDAGEADSSGARIPDGMVFIPAGEFEMGISEEDVEYLQQWGHDVPHMNRHLAWIWFGGDTPRHTVPIDSFYMDVYEVTNEQFERFVRETGYRSEGTWRRFVAKERMNHPVVSVSWNDAKAYAEWCGKRLPTEAEWEYAAKGGKEVKWFPWGDTLDAARANYGKDKSFWANVLRVLKLNNPKTTPVGSYPANGFGLHDMGGNVSEWCEDVYKPYPGGPQDPQIFSILKKKPIEKRVVRGGYWQCPSPVFMRISSRSGLSPNSFDYRRGFRCAKSIR